ncbi:MAG TPA: Re/Si-specific NAD(P)(+) transhydrogenase subunit alpha [Candidatus Polarisedimenticolaceae bacterium]|nr:Re/Si-specific NAD(P)(+) transhydrogenase subunit alpha [Candidatus Polarisedimenticolaceae bacterium]
MIVGVPKETDEHEGRVAVTPRTAVRLRQMGLQVFFERGAGARAEFDDQQYAEAGATLVDGPVGVFGRADIVLKVAEPGVNRALGHHEVELMRPGTTLIGFIWPAQNRDLVAKLAARGITTFAMDCVPRITRAQKMDALSAMANLAGYRAVIAAAHVYPRLISGQVTAAGTVAPAKVLVIGGGVAGLAAIAAARGLGAIVRAFDPRPAVREQVESLGAEFIPLDFKEDATGEGGYAKEMSDAFLQAELALIAKQAMEVDIIISTALIPGKPAPKLITAGMVESMREGSVIVDLAAPQGGNCVLTRPGEAVRHRTIRILGYTDFTSRPAMQSSWLYSSTVVNFLAAIVKDGALALNLEDEVQRGALVTHGGQVTWPPPRLKAAQDAGLVSSDKPLGPKPVAAVGKAAQKSGQRWVPAVLAALVLLAIGLGAPPSFLGHFTVFVLACFVGWQVVWNVTPALHTPLMSVTNAISGIIILGGMLQLSSRWSTTTVLGALAVLLAMINVTGGFLVTRRMLAMFHR